MVGYIAGTTLAYTTVPLVLVSLPILYGAILFWFPHTPQYLVSENRITVNLLWDIYKDKGYLSMFDFDSLGS